jgi:hypothetical protein
LDAVVYRRPTVWRTYPKKSHTVAMRLIRIVNGSRGRERPDSRSTASTSEIPIKKRRKRNVRGGTWSRAAFVAGNVAPQITVVRRIASRGITGDQVLSAES